ncbi:MAG: class I SAM-dependent methyltransferase [Burkholderiales bacterium]
MPAFDDARTFWDKRFDTSEYIFGTEPNVFLTREQSRLPAGARILDVACGEGRNAVWLASLGHRVTGFDISPLAIGKARALADARKVQVNLRVADVRTWEWEPGAFDAVVCVFIQFASPEVRTRLFEGFRSTLAPGGIVLLQGYTPKQLEYRTGGPGDASHLYTPALLESALTGFEMLRLEAHEAVLAEGSKHVGRSALIDVVARKPG